MHKSLSDYVYAACFLCPELAQIVVAVEHVFGRVAIGPPISTVMAAHRYHQSPSTHTCAAYLSAPSSTLNARSLHGATGLQAPPVCRHALDPASAAPRWSSAEAVAAAAAAAAPRAPRWQPLPRGRAAPPATGCASCRLHHACISVCLPLSVPRSY